MTVTPGACAKTAPVGERRRTIGSGAGVSGITLIVRRRGASRSPGCLEVRRDGAEDNRYVD